MSDLYFDESLILKDLEARSKEEVLERMAANLFAKGLVKESFASAVIDREDKFATGLPTHGVSVAIPHTDAEHVRHKTISLGILKEPVDFGIMGEATAQTPVKLVFMLAMDEQDSQLSLLQRLMGIFQNEETLTALAEEKNLSNIKKILAGQLGVTVKEVN
ncbi:PTS sugar transporter subunit IIA [Kroppenstedtia eburnea]|uniref:PTS sugar transporter subunit IIA n=1 Tax=Kroppenstedtia eburnea TaxID=714067 RepID=UPI003641E319